MSEPADKWMQNADELIFANSTGWVKRGPKEWAKLRQAIARALEATDKAAREEEREWLNAMPISWELSCENDDKSDLSSDMVWVVYRVHGGRNDKEWDKLGRGDTPSKAISAAFLTAAIRKGTE